MTGRTVQGMVRARSGQAPAWPLSADRSARTGSGVKRDFACTPTKHVPPVVVGRSQPRLRREGRARTTSGPSPDSSPARTLTLFAQCRLEAQDNLLSSRLSCRAASGPRPPPATWRCQSPNPTAPAVVRRAAGKCAAIGLGLVKEDPKLRPWFSRRSHFTLFSVFSNCFYSCAHFVQGVVPDLQHPFYWDYPMACEHRHVVEYSEGSIDQADIQFVFRDTAGLGGFSDHQSPFMEILRHERGVNFPIGCPLLLPSLHVYGYQRYDDSQSRNYNGCEVLPGLEPTHGNTILLQSAARGRDVTPLVTSPGLWPDTSQSPDPCEWTLV